MENTCGVPFGVTVGVDLGVTSVPLSHKITVFQQKK